MPEQVNDSRPLPPAVTRGFGTHTHTRAHSCDQPNSVFPGPAANRQRIDDIQAAGRRNDWGGHYPSRRETGSDLKRARRKRRQHRGVGEEGAK